MPATPRCAHASGSRDLPRRRSDKRLRFAIPRDPLSLRQLHDVVGGIAQSYQIAPAPVAGQDHRSGEPSWQRRRAWIVRSAICFQGRAECSSSVLFRRFDCRSFRADCCAFLSRSRSSFNSDILVRRLVELPVKIERFC
jgi:hypothetical protein